jgi:hypothetical protein
MGIFLFYGLVGAVPPTEAAETPVTKQADCQETSVHADSSEGTFVVHFITEWPAWRKILSWSDCRLA